MLRRQAIALLLCAMPAAAAAQVSSPQELLDGIFKPYLAAGYKGEAYWDADRFFEPALADAIKRDRETSQQSGKAPLLKNDPFVSPLEQPRDWQISKLVIVAAPAANGATTAQVMFVNQKKPSHLTIDLKQTSAGWRISEVRGNGPPLRTLYKLH